MSNKKINQIEVKNPTTGAYELILDLANITADASDILEGKTYYNQFGEQQTGTLVPEDETPIEVYNLPDICFYDFKGTLLYAYTKEQFERLGQMPEGEDDYNYGLYFVEWNYTYQEVLQAKGTVVVGGIYSTGSEHITKLYVETDSSSRLVGLNCYFDGILKINWGDNTTTEYQSSSTTDYITHTYSYDRDYTITLDLSGADFVHFGGYLVGDGFANGPVTGIAFGDDVPSKTVNFDYDMIFGATWHKIKFITLPITTKYVELGYGTLPLEYYALPKGAYTSEQPINYVTDSIDSFRRSCVSIPISLLTAEQNNYGYASIYMALPFRHLILCNSEYLNIYFDFYDTTDKTKYFGQTLNFAYLTTIPEINELDSSYFSKLQKYNLTIYVPAHDGECSADNEQCWKYHTNWCAAAHLMEEV